MSNSRYLNPTPMGYCDFNLCVELVLEDGTLYVCEMQVLSFRLVVPM